MKKQFNFSAHIDYLKFRDHVKNARDDQAKNKLPIAYEPAPQNTYPGMSTLRQKANTPEEIKKFETEKSRIIDDLNKNVDELTKRLPEVDRQAIRDLAKQELENKVPSWEKESVPPMQNNDRWNERSQEKYPNGKENINQPLKPDKDHERE